MQRRLMLSCCWLVAACAVLTALVTIAPHAAATPATVSQAGFSDTADSPYGTAIEDLALRGVASGYADGTFQPERTIANAQFAKMIVLALGLPVVEGTYPGLFSDVPDDPTSLYPDDYAAVAAANGLLETYFTDFHPFDEMVARAEAVVGVARGLEGSWPALLPEAADPNLSPWPDLDGPYGSLVARAAAAGLLADLPLASLDYGLPMTRGEAAQLIDNLAKLVEGQNLENRWSGPALNPWHNHYYQYATDYTVKEILPDPSVRSRTFPDSVPAYYAPPRPVPTMTDLDFRVFSSPGQYPEGTSLFPAWQDPNMEGLLALRRDLANPHPPALHDSRVVLPVVRDFLQTHDLWQLDLTPGTAVWGQTVVGPGVYRAGTVEVTFEQRGVSGDGTLPGRISVTVTAGDTPVQIGWELLSPQVVGQVGLRPLADVLLDLSAWEAGLVEWDSWPAPETRALRLAATDVYLDYERVRNPLSSDRVGLTLVPVYRFRVQLLSAEGSRGASGTWSVCAAVDVQD